MMKLIPGKCKGEKCQKITPQVCCYLGDSGLEVVSNTQNKISEGHRQVRDRIRMVLDKVTNKR